MKWWWWWLKPGAGEKHVFLAIKVLIGTTIVLLTAFLVFLVRLTLTNRVFDIWNLVTVHGWPFWMGRLPDLLIDTESCVLPAWPLFDSQTRYQYIGHYNQEYPCPGAAHRPVTVERVNLTWIRLRRSDPQWQCTACEIVRDASKDGGHCINETIVPLQHEWTNFVSNRSGGDLAWQEPDPGKWDAVQVRCRHQDTGAWLNPPWLMPLVQRYREPMPLTPPPPFNVLLLGIDSVSMLNFVRHFVKTKRLLDARGFLPLYGYHKVGLNSFPNIVALLTGHHAEEYFDARHLNRTASRAFTFDHLPFLFDEYRAQGYVTAFVEDMGPYGFFQYAGKGGFRRQPTHYYLKPINLALWKHLDSHYCHHGQTEDQMYLDFLADLLLQRLTPAGQRHFVLCHLSTMTHDLLNNAGYLDRPLEGFLDQAFAQGYHRDTFIVLYSDHGLRFGQGAKTRSSLYEQRLPVLYMYVPESVPEAARWREALATNRHRLTSHFDVHATLLHALRGRPPTGLLPYGLSLFEPIPANRTCAEAGIPDNYCLCNGTFEPMHNQEPLVSWMASFAVNHTNQILEPVRHLCAPLSLKNVEWVMRSRSQEPGARHRHAKFLFQYQVLPSRGLFEAMVNGTLDTADGGGGGHQLTNMTLMGPIARRDRYGNQARCLPTTHQHLERFCYCIP